MLRNYINLSNFTKMDNIDNFNSFINLLLVKFNKRKENMQFKLIIFKTYINLIGNVLLKKFILLRKSNLLISTNKNVYKLSIINIKNVLNKLNIIKDNLYQNLKMEDKKAFSIYKKKYIY